VNVAVVTGASRGIGRACAISLGERGFTVYVTGRGRADPTLPGQLGSHLAGTGTGVAQDGLSMQWSEADATRASPRCSSRTR